MLIEESTFEVTDNQRSFVFLSGAEAADKAARAIMQYANEHDLDIKIYEVLTAVDDGDVENGPALHPFTVDLAVGSDTTTLTALINKFNDYFVEPWDDNSVADIYSYSELMDLLNKIGIRATPKDVTDQYSDQPAVEEDEYVDDPIYGKTANESYSNPVSTLLESAARYM